MRRHTTNYDRNYCIMSHGKLICECWTLLLGNLVMSGLWGMQASPMGHQASSLASQMGFSPWAAGSCAFVPIQRSTVMSPMLTLWAAVQLHSFPRLLSTSYLLSFAMKHTTKGCRQFPPRRIFSPTHTETYPLVYTSWPIGRARIYGT